jgi:hypothetical protein
MTNRERAAVLLDALTCYCCADPKAPPKTDIDRAAQALDDAERRGYANGYATAAETAAQMTDGIADTRQHVQDKPDALIRETARILAERIRALPPPKEPTE